MLFIKDNIPYLRRSLEYTKNSRGGLGIMCDTPIVEHKRKVRAESEEKEEQIEVIRTLHDAGLNAIQIANVLSILNLKK